MSNKNINFNGLPSIHKFRFPSSPILLLVPGLIIIIFLFLWPLGQMLMRSFTDPELGFSNYIRFFKTTSAVSSMITTMKANIKYQPPISG